MTDAMFEVMLQRIENPATANRIAKFKKNLYDALIKQGFTKEQALLIAEKTAIPTIGSVTKWLMTERSQH